MKSPKSAPERRFFVTHFWAHFDEYVAMILLWLYGEKAGIRGARNAEVLFDDAGSSVPACIASKHWRETALIPIGIWGGLFDEHSDSTHARKHNECAASLALRFLKERVPEFDDPRAETLVAYATRIDLEGGATKYSLANIVKNMNWLGGQEKTLLWIVPGLMIYLDRGDPKDSSFEVESIGALMLDGDTKTTWLLKGLEAVEWEKTKFQEAVETLKQGRKTIHFTDRLGRKRDLVAMESDNPMMGKAIVSWAKADVAIVRKPSGNVVVLTNAKTRTDLTGLVRAVNREELFLRGDREERRFGDLSPTGSVPGSVWSFQPDLMCVLNGSPSAPFVPATDLSFAQIIELARLALDEKRFCTAKEGFACDGQSCPSSRRRPCPYFVYGLPRCQHIRQITKYGAPVTESEPASHHAHDVRFAPLEGFHTTAG
jgi:hypothetical protein